MTTIIDIERAKAQKFSEVHRLAWEDPHHLGEIKKVWQDDNGDLCIMYSCGEWYHYRLVGNRLEWW